MYTLTERIPIYIADAPVRLRRYAERVSRKHCGRTYIYTYIYLYIHTYAYTYIYSQSSSPFISQTPLSVSVAMPSE